MSLSKIQIEVLRLLAANGNPESCVAGAAVLNRDAPRYSGDIDVYHAREDRAAFAAINDSQIPETASSEFFPVVQDDTFGYMLHPVDLATNKAMTAAGRRELRDIVDLVTVHETILPLAAVIWAAVEKAPGYTPEGFDCGNSAKLELSCR